MTAAPDPGSRYRAAGQRRRTPVDGRSLAARGFTPHLPTLTAQERKPTRYRSLDEARSWQQLSFPIFLLRNFNYGWNVLAKP